MTPSDQTELRKLLTIKFGELMIKSESYPNVGQLVNAAIPLIAAAEQRAELYGRLHETIEHFQAGAISAEYYSAKYEEIASKLAELEQSLRKEQE